MTKKINIEDPQDQHIPENSENQQTNETTNNTAKNTGSNESCEELEQKAKELEKQLNLLNDKYLRLAAEYDNYRKRTLREKAELIKTAGENILVDILPVMDDFERALEHIDSATDIEALKEGVELIYKRFKDFLKQKGVEEIEALGQPLDTDLHEAVQQVPAQDESQKGKIVHVVQKGYKLNDKVIRHAKVVVAM